MLCRAVADFLDLRFNPVTVRGEISGFSRAASGHCYFSLKDASGQLRCAMFRRAATLLGFTPRDGEAVELRARIGVYEPRGELQLVVESMQRAGAGALFEQFIERKARLEVEGLFDPARKRPLPVMPRAIGLVTSLGAAALHDVMSALHRRVPHIPVVLVPAAVQGAGAPAELVQALTTLYAFTPTAEPGSAPIDVILLVRGGGSIEDLWAFNDESLARTIVRSPVPLVCGVGHETDFTIADFSADLRAPTPTAAAELVAASRDTLLDTLDLLEERLQGAMTTHVDSQGQRLDQIAARFGRPSERIASHRFEWSHLSHRLNHAMLSNKERSAQNQRALEANIAVAFSNALAREHARLAQAQLRLELLDPRHALRRGYAWLSDAHERTVTSVRQLKRREAARATLADGTIFFTVGEIRAATRSRPTFRKPASS